jgi:hypothetical protein
MAAMASSSSGSAGVLPAGKDWSGSCVCVGLAGDDRGRVLYYDHEMERLMPLVGSLSALLSGLRYGPGLAGADRESAKADFVLVLP